MEATKQQAIKEIINEIELISKKKGFWSIDTQRLIEITRIAPHKFREYLYKTRRKINMPSDINIFNNDNPEDLISLLELIYDVSIEDDFTNAGIFISYKQRIELNELFISYVNDTLQSHSIIEDDFLAMLYGTNTFIEARNIYYDELFNINNFINETCKRFLSEKSFKLFNLAEKNVTNYLKSLFERNIFTKEEIFYILEERLKNFAFSKNLYKIEKQPDADSYKKYNYKTKCNTKREQMPHKQAENKIENAKKIMGLDDNLNLEIIKKKYK